MSFPDWALPATAAVAMVGLGLFGIYSNIGANAESSARPVSAPKQVIPVWDPGDEEPSAQQSDDTLTPTPLPTLTQPTSSADTETLTDPWVSERMEAASKEPFVDELKELGEAAQRNSDHAGRPADSIPSEVESSVSKDTTTSSQNPAQPSTDQYPDTTPQQAPPQTLLPDLPKDTETSPPPPTNTTAPGGIDGNAGEGSDKRERILIVEDSRALSENLATLLNREPDLEVLGPTSSPTECRNFAAGGEGFDVSVVDLSLPDAQGIDLINELRKSCPDAPILVLTTSLDPRDQAQAIKAGADAVLSKSADLAEILSTIRRLSRG
jgi:CheY-like chemotaxis protein